MTLGEKLRSVRSSPIVGQLIRFGICRRHFNGHLLGRVPANEPLRILAE